MFYSISLGTAQILGFALKKLLEEKFDISIDETKRLTFGQTRARLETEVIRSDFTELLKEVVKNRNNAAHELLANQAIIGSLGVELSERFQFKELKHFIFGLERATFIFDHTQHHDAWILDA